MATDTNPLATSPSARDAAIARRNRLTGLAIAAVILVMMAISVVGRHHMFPALFQGVL